MERYPNEKECIVFGREERGVAVVFKERRRRFIRAARRILLLSVIVVAVVALVRSDIAGKQGFGANGFFGFLGGGRQETLSPPDTEETEGNDSENLGESDTETEKSVGSEGESDTLSNTEEESAPEISEIDLSENEKGSLHFINYSNKTPDVEGILAESFTGSRAYYTEEPVVMIIHSQTSQAYIDASDDATAVLCGVVSVGERVCYELNRRGISAVHCTVIHDGEGDSYKNTAETIETMLEVYPSVRYVIDLQRMNITDNKGNIAKTLVSEGGAAQMRLTVSAGADSWKKCFSLALHVREKLNASEGICMPIVLTDVGYNSELAEYYLKLDIGAFGNTSKEAGEAGKLFAAALAETMKK